MRFFLISDNVDTQIGLRLAGIDGVVVHESQEVEDAIANALEDSSIGVILITQKLVSLCPKTVYDIKLHRHIPLIVEIPDRHGDGRSESAISEYVREAIGININQ